MSQGRPALLQYVLIGLHLESKRTNCHLLKLLALVNTLAQVPQTPAHQRLPARLLRMCHHAPAVEHAIHGLCLRRRDSHGMHSTIKILFFLPAKPFGESFRHFKVSLLGEHPINHLYAVVSRDHIVLPHVESEFELAAPEIRQLAPHHVQLAMLLVLMALVQHPLLKFAIKHQPLRMPLGKEFRYLAVLLQEHHRVASKFEPEREGVFLLAAIAVQDQISQPVDRAELVDVAARHPEHLIDGPFFAAVGGAFESLFELSRRQQLHMHAVNAAHMLPGALVEVHRVAILALQLEIASLCLIFLTS